MTQCLELQRSRTQDEGSQNTVELIYIILDAVSDALAMSELKTTAPLSYNGLNVVAYNLSPLGYGTWQGTARYGTAVGIAAANAEYVGVTWETGTETEHRTIALDAPPEERRWVARDGTGALRGNNPSVYPTFLGAVGWDGEKLNGYDVVVPRLVFAVTRRFMRTEWTNDFFRLVTTKAGRVNSGAFWCWDAGELLYLGCSGSRKYGGEINQVADVEGVFSNFDGVLGVTRDSSDNGTLYFELVQVGEIPIIHDINVYDDAAMTNKVAEAQAIGEAGTKTLSEVGGSGISGEVVVASVAETEAIVTWPFEYEAQFRIAVSENITEADNFSIGLMQSVVKEGWQYLWVQYEKQVNADTKTQYPYAAFVENVYKTLDFDLLLLGANPFIGDGGS